MMLRIVRVEGLLAPKVMTVRGLRAPATRALATAIAHLGRAADGARTAIGALAAVTMMLMMMGSVVVVKERATRVDDQAKANLGRGGVPLARLPDSGGPETA